MEASRCDGRRQLAIEGRRLSSASLQDHGNRQSFPTPLSIIFVALQWTNHRSAFPKSPTREEQPKRYAAISRPLQLRFCEWLDVTGPAHGQDCSSHKSTAFKDGCALRLLVYCTYVSRPG